MKMDTRVFPDIDAVSRVALDAMIDIMTAAVQQRGRFVVLLSGGRTPEKMYRLWADREQQAAHTPWDRVHLFWGDERYVPKDDPFSNYRMTREALIARVPIPAANVHPVPGPDDFPTPEAAAKAHDAELHTFFGSSAPVFDLQLLGLGIEGHTASLFPGSEALEEKQRWVMAVEAPAKPPRRLTFTPVVLNQARNTFFLVAGADKREIVRALRTEPDGIQSEYPAGRIRPAGAVVWFLDQAAMS